MACGATLKRSLEFDPVHGPSERSAKRQRCMPMTMSMATPPTKQHQINRSPFEIPPQITSDDIAAHLSAEILKLQRRGRLESIAGKLPGFAGTPSAFTPSAQSTTDKPPAPSDTAKDKPLFTLKQVGLVCERMLREREDELRNEYDKVLESKLLEQYESFVKFNYDQIHRRFGEASASYFS